MATRGPPTLAIPSATASIRTTSASVGSPHITPPESAPCDAKKWSDVRSAM